MKKGKIIMRNFFFLKKGSNIKNVISDWYVVHISVI